MDKMQFGSGQMQLQGNNMTSFQNGMKKTFRNRNAFTLIELLVVIAIIAILAAMLLPALAKAKQHAQLAIDLNNNKQIVTSTHMFAGDNDDSMPRPGWMAVFDCWAYGNSAANPFPYGPGASGTAAQYATIYPQQLDAFKRGQLYSYFQNPKILMCPGDLLDSLFYQRTYYLSSYIWNGAVTGYDTATDNTYKLSRFKPTNILQWESDENSPPSFNDGADFPSEGFTRRHNGIRSGDPTQDVRGRVTVGLFDGSSKQMSPKDLYQLAGDLYTDPASGNLGPDTGTVVPNDLWCNPASPDGAYSAFP
jgi:prepilin-type N-terminal cleavage/methylation domain-containing protein